MRTSKTIEQQAKFYEVDNFVNYLEESYINGNFSQCKKLFKELKKDDRKRAIREMNDEEIRNFYLNII